MRGGRVPHATGGSIMVCLFLLSLFAPGNIQNATDLTLSNSSAFDSPGKLSPGSFILAPPSANFSLRDDFDYPSISAMVAAGWDKCGDTMEQSYYNVSGGVLTVVNDGQSAAVMCWRDIPRGVSDWEVATRTAYAGGSVPQVQLAVFAGSHHYRVLNIGGGYGTLQLLRDDFAVLETSSYIPRVGEWHDLKMEMRTRSLSVYSDGLLAFAYAEPDLDTELSRIDMAPAWIAHDSYDYVAASQIDPNAPYFSMTVSPGSQTVATGLSATYTVSISSSNSFSQPVTLNASVSSSGQYLPVLAFSPAIVTPMPGGSASSNLTVSTEPVLSASTIYIRVNATSGTLLHSAQVILTVSAPATDFIIRFSPSIGRVAQLGDGSWPVQKITVVVQGSGGFTGTVNLSSWGDVGGVSGTVTPSSVFLSPNGIANATLEVTYVGSAYVSGSFRVFVSGTSGAVQHTTYVMVDFVPSYFAVGGDPYGLVVAPGSPGTFNIRIKSYNNFASTITIAASISPYVVNGPTLSFSATTLALTPNETTTLPVIVSLETNTPRQPYQVTITVSGQWWSGYAAFSIYPVSHAYIPGVTPGTWASYEIMISSFPDHVLSARLTVTEVAGSNVTYSVDLYLDQRLLNSTLAYVDVALGSFSNPIVPAFLTASLLRVGDQIYPGQPQSLSIQTSVRRPLLGSLRMTNTGKTPPNIFGDISASWDSSTGILASLNATIPIDGTWVTARYRLTGTNAWARLALLISSQTSATPLVPVSFTSQVSGGTPPYLYSWSFGDRQSSTQANPVHAYNLPGNYTVTLNVTDGDGNTEARTTRVTVSVFRAPLGVFQMFESMLAWVPFALAIYVPAVSVLSYFVVRDERRKHRRLITPTKAHTNS